MRRNILFLLMLLVALFAGTQGMFAQFETASLVGRVTDATGAVVPGVTVTATNVETGVSISRVTDKSGEYAIPALRNGQYRLVATKDGFDTITRENVNLAVGTDQRVDLTLTIGANETVSVQASDLVLETETSQKQQVISSEQIEAFPLMDMKYSDLVGLAAGAVSAPAQEDLGTTSLVREGSYNINGQRSTFNNYLLDGMDNNAHGTSNQGFSNQIIQPSTYSISQFSIVTTLPAAEFGRSSGGTINTAFKQGTNKIHGNLYESIRNTVANANGYFRAAPSAGTSTKTTMQRNQFGGNLGGYIKHDRFFYFVDYEGLRQVRQVVNFANIFKESDHQLIASPNASNNTTAVTNPYTGAKYPSDRPLPRSVVSPIALKIIDAFPMPNNNGAGVTSISSNWAVLQRFVDTYDKEDVRLDAQWTPRMSSFLRVSQSKEHALDGPTLPLPLEGAKNGYMRVINQQVALGLTRQIGASQLLEARLGASFTKGGKHPNGLNYPETFGIPGTPSDPRVSGGLVTQEISGYSTFGRQSTNPQWQYPFFLNPKVSYSWLMGHHNFKTGYEFGYLRQSVQDVNPIYGDMSYQSSFTGYTISDFYFGAPNEIDLTTFYIAHIRQGGHSFFFQDDWKIHPKLTLNLGVRYEYTSHFYEKDDRLTNYDPVNTPLNGQMIRARSGHGAYARQLIDPDLNDWMPRIGFAYAPWTKLVIRGGYGIGYVHYTRSGEVDNLAVNGPQVNQRVFNQVPAKAPCAVSNPPTCGKPSSNFYSIDDGFPAGMADPANFNLFTSRVLYVPRNYRDPYVQSWYFGFQAALGKNRVAEITYVGNHSVKLQAVGIFNQRNPDLDPADPLDVNGFFKRPYANIGDVTMSFNGGYANYHGLQTRFEQKALYGMWFLNAFTWSRTFENVSGPLESSYGHSASIQDFYKPHNPKDYGPSNFDRPIVNTTSLTWNLPIGRGKPLFRHISKGWDTAIGGWSISAINTFRSGPALTPNFSPASGQQLSDTGNVQYRPYLNYPVFNSLGMNVLQLAKRRLKVPGHPEQAFCDTVYANPSQAAYNGCGYYGVPPVGATSANPTVYTYFSTTNPYHPNSTDPLYNDPRGDVPNGFLRGDSFDQLDVNLYKTFKLPEFFGYRSSLQVRGQFYNILNKTNFATPGMTCCSTSFGRITQTYGPGRIGQIQARLYW